MIDSEIVDPLVHLVMSLDEDSRKRLVQLIERAGWWAVAQSKHENRGIDDCLARGRAISEASLEIGDIMVSAAASWGW
jgi:hypothetical protein